jgi:hypothetical protein
MNFASWLPMDADGETTSLCTTGGVEASKAKKVPDHINRCEMK